jgi:hypothetical protein
MNSYIENLYPTDYHPAEFWEHLGRAVANFGFLENVLAQAICALTTTVKCSDDEAKEELKKLENILEKALTDTLLPLSKSYLEAAKVRSIDVTGIVKEIEEITRIRNVLCHGSWRAPDIFGGSIPFFVGRNKEIFDTAVDVPFLKIIQKGTIKIACDVVNSVIQNGIDFPGLKNQ